MKKQVRAFVGCVVLLFLVATPGQSLWSQDSSNDSRPVLVVSVASVERLIGDIEYVTRVSGWPAVGGFIRLITAPYVQDVDPTSPAGWLAALKDNKPSGVVFLGAANFPGILAKIEEQLVKPQDIGGGLLKLSLQQDYFLKQEGKWVYVADQVAHLGGVPADPSQFLGGLDKRYTLAARVDVGRIPRELRDGFLNQLRTGAERQLARDMADKPAAEQEQARQIAQQGLALLAALVADTDQVTVGWGTDSAGGKTFLDVSLTAREGTKLAEHMRNAAATPARFAGLAAGDNVVSLAYDLTIPPRVLALSLPAAAQARERLLKQIESSARIPGEEAKAALQEAVSTLGEVFVASLARGELHGGLVCKTTATSLQVAAGAAVVDGARLEPALRKLADGLGNQAGLPHVSFDVQSYQGTEFHRLRWTLPESRVIARQLLGPELELVIGTAPDHIGLALGTDAVELLTQVVDAAQASPASAGSPLSVSMAVRPLLALAQRLDSNPTVTAMSKAVSNSPGGDQLTLTARSLERGVVYRLEVQEGALCLIGELVKLRGTTGGEP